MENVIKLKNNSIQGSKVVDRNILSNTLTTCNSCHLRMKCQHTKFLREEFAPRIKEAVEENQERYKEHPGDNAWAKQLMEDLDKTKALLTQEFNDRLVGRQCDFEKEDISENLIELQKKYNFDDPRVFLIVKEHIRQSVIDFRAFKLAASEDIVTRVQTKEGSYTIINPIHTFKMQSGKHMIDLIKTLDNITKGDEIIKYIKTGNSRLFTDFIGKL